MKIERRKRLLPALTVAAALLMAGGSYYGVAPTLFANDKVQAYTSAHNNVSPVDAADTYVVNVPDANFKAALNAAIAAKTSTTRSATQNITFGEMKTLSGLVPQDAFSGKGISSLEGAQFLQTATILYFNNNQITDLAPLAGLVNAQRFYLRSNQITDLAPLANLTKLQRVDLNHNHNLTSISHLQGIDGLVEVNVGGTRVGDIASLAGKNRLQFFHVDAMQGGARPDLTPISNLPALLSVNTGHTRYTHEELVVLKDAPALARLNVSGNNVYDLKALFSEGFGLLQAQHSTFTEEKHNVSTPSKVLLNPIKDLSGNSVPVTETADVKNVDASGNPSQTGGHLLLVNATGSGSVSVNWRTDFILPSFNGATRPFSGILTIDYTLDEDAPVFNPDQPAKITTRKGQPISLDDVAATDAGVGVNADGVQNNAATISLDVANPSEGNYTVIYTAADNNDNTATVMREVEVTNADDLQTAVASVTDDMLEGKTDASVQAVKDAVQVALGFITDLNSSQQQIDDALQTLNDAIASLADKPAAPSPAPSSPALGEPTQLTAVNGLSNDKARGSTTGAPNTGHAKRDVGLIAAAFGGASAVIGAIFFAITRRK